MQRLFGDALRRLQWTYILRSPKFVFEMGTLVSQIDGIAYQSEWESPQVRGVAYECLLLWPNSPTNMCPLLLQCRTPAVTTYLREGV